VEAIKFLPDESPAPAPIVQRSCDECQAPLDEQQRFCVRCGARQPDAYDPAARYFGATTQRRRAPAPRSPKRSASASRWAALFLAMLPVAVAIGVLVGKGNSNDQKLIDALSRQRGTVAAATAGGPAAGTSTSTVAAATGGNLPSDFPLDKGYTVSVATLPLRATDRAAATKAEADAKAKGAPSVGLINPRQFKMTPSQGADSYVVYAGTFKAKGGADALLAKLKKKIPGAKVIAVASLNGSGGQGKVLSTTSLGSAHKVAGFKATPAKVKHDTQLVQNINRRTGQSYIQSQRGLPDQIVIGGTPGSAPAPSTGPGQP
jgi:hypothetical protein